MLSLARWRLTLGLQGGWRVSGRSGSRRADGRYWRASRRRHNLHARIARALTKETLPIDVGSGPTPEGLYGALLKGARWVGGADPAGDPEGFIPGSEAYVFDIAEWRWDKQLWIDATTNSAGNLAGFGLVLGLSDGKNTDAVEVWEHKGRRGAILKERQEWTIPRGHPTRELALVSHGEQTTQVLHKA
jgi:hypothetical protein